MKVIAALCAFFIWAQAGTGYAQTFPDRAIRFIVPNPAGGSNDAAARILANALTEHLPKTAALLEKIAADFGSKKFPATFRRLYPRCENISVDYAILEPRSAKGEQDSNIFCLRADFGWNDLGSWTALHEHGSAKDPAADGNLISAQGIFTADANRNYVHAPGKFVAVIGVNDVVVVETEDALLVTTRENSQDVGKVVKYLDEKKLKRLV